MLYTDKFFSPVLMFAERHEVVNDLLGEGGFDVVFTLSVLKRWETQKSMEHIYFQFFFHFCWDQEHSNLFYEILP